MSLGGLPGLPRMLTLATNIKITAPKSSQASARATFAKLEAKLIPVSERMDVFALPGGGNLAYDYVPDAEALTPAQMRSAPWLEITVDNLETRKKQFLDAGFVTVEFRDQDHPYLAGPGGFVVRLALGGQPMM